MSAKSVFRTRFRIVTDSYAGYEVQRRYWWCPFWVQVGVNTFSTIEKAKAFAESRRDRVVMVIDDENGRAAA